MFAGLVQRNATGGRPTGMARSRRLALLVALSLVACLVGGTLWLASTRPPGRAVPPAEPTITSTSSTVTPTPSTAAPAGSSVEVDVFSGRPNPVVVLDPGLVDQLYLRLADRDAAGEVRAAAEPTSTLGFRGFVVHPTDAARSALRIVPSGAYLIGQPTKLSRSTDYYDLVYLALRDHLAPEVLAALPAPSIPLTTTSVSAPPLVGVAATWVLADPGKVTPASTSIVVKATRAQCSDGKTGRLRAPVVSTSASDVVVRIDAEPNPPGAYSCPGNDAVEVTVQLPEPLGRRRLLDASCLSGDLLTTSFCSDGAVRWTP